MKILVVGFCPPEGAIADNFRQIVASLAQHADVATIRSHGLALDESRLCDSVIVNYSKKSPLGILAPASLREIRATLALFKPDVVFFFTQNILNVVVSLLVGRTPQAFWWHEPRKRGRTTPLKQVLYSLHDFVLVRRARSLIVACEAMRTLIHPSLQRKVHVIPLPFLEQFESAESAESAASAAPAQIQTQDLLFFGNVERYKGLEILGAALVSLYAEGKRPTLLVIGRGDYQQHCPTLWRLHEQFPDAIQIDARYAAYARVVQAVRSSRIIVLPYLSSSGTNTVPIAFRYGKPVIATTTGCFQDMIQQGKTGLLVPPGDSAALAAAIVALLDDPLRADSFAEAAIGYYQASFTQERVTARLLETFRETLS